ncbi:hypothetical protein [Bradyrhizobium sp. ORS 86]|uniref:hypothetical protein n=1 Tax=Bradyrhizobium sp. ORS 86 TaxID=1685970 RepID=UPI00388F1C90
MKNFPDAAFSPEVIELMTRALESSVATLPDPVNTSQITLIAESICAPRMKANARSTRCSG